MKYSLCTDPGFNTSDAFSEPAEMEYLRKVLFEYMMGRETKVCFVFSCIVVQKQTNMEIVGRKKSRRRQFIVLWQQWPQK